MGLKVLLVDADLRKPSLHTKLDLRNTEGLADYLSGYRSPSEIIQATTLPTLAFMSSGRPRSNASELLARRHLTALLSNGTVVFDLDR